MSSLTEELVKTKGQLAKMENAYLEALRELASTRQLVDELNFKLKKAVEISMKDRLWASKVEHASFMAAEDWQADMEAMKQQHDTEISALQSVKDAYEGLKTELAAAITSKEEALRTASEAQEAAKNAVKRAERLSADWQVDMEAMKQQHDADISALQIVKDAHEDLKTEFAVAITAKEEALRTASEAQEAAKNAVKQAECLSAELAETKASFCLARKTVAELSEELSVTKAALAEVTAICQHAFQEGAIMVAMKEAELKYETEESRQLKSEIEQLKTELSAFKIKASELVKTNSMLENLKRQLADAKEAEDQQAQAAKNANSKLENMLCEVRVSEMAKSKAVSLLASVYVELEKTRQNWNMASVEVGTLTATLSSIETKLEGIQPELQEVWGKGTSAQAEVAASAAKFYEAADGLESTLMKDQCGDLKMDFTTVLAEAKTEAHSLQQHISRANMEAQKQSVKAEAAREGVLSLRKTLGFAQHDAQRAQTDLQLAIDKLQLARDMAAEYAPESITERSQRSEVSTAENELNRGVRIDASLAEDQVLILTGALVAAREAAQQIEQKLEVTRGELAGARTEAAAAKAEVVKAKSEMKHAKKEQERACKALAVANQDTLHAKKEQERACKALAVAREATLAEQDQARYRREEAEAATIKIEQLEGMKKIELQLGDTPTQGKCKGSAESWEIVGESGSESGITVTQDEYGTWKQKVQEAEGVSASLQGELDSLRIMNEKLSNSLQLAKLEIAAIKVSEQDALQQYESAQHEKLALEAEVQRLANKGEQVLRAWELGPNTLNLSPLISKDAKAQHESSRRLSYGTISSPPPEEEGDESAEFPLFSTKKKKKRALLVRIGTYLSKKTSP